MTDKELVAKLGFRVTNTPVPGSNGRPAYNSVMVISVTGHCWPGDGSHWKMWEALRDS